MSELKRCPFCGGEAKILETDVGSFRVICKECSCSVGRYWYWSIEEAINAWNTRKSMERIVERLEHFNEEVFVRANGRANGKSIAYGYSKGIEKALMIVKEEGGLNE